MKTQYLEDDSYMSVAAIPGQSFTDQPGNNPYEKPAAIVNPEQALAGLVSNLKEPTVSSDIVGLLDAGLSAETIASAMVMKAFTEGFFTPDVAEIIKEPLMRFILRIGLDAGVEDMNVVNEFPQEGISEDDKLSMMESLNPEKHARIMDKYAMLEKDELQDMEDERNMMQEQEEQPAGFITPREEI